MPFELFTAYAKLPLFALVLSRIAGLIMFQPVIGGHAIPMRVRALFVASLALLVTPLLHAPAHLPSNYAALAVAMAAELLLGALIGLIVRMVFLGVQLGGQLIAQESGMAFGQIADPSTGMPQSIVSSLYLQIAGVVFLILGGHRALICITLDSFQSIPLLGANGLFARGVPVLLDAFTLGSEIALRVGAPVVLTLFLVNVALGFISRTVPQLNIIMIGFSLKGMVAFLLMSVALPAALIAFTDGLELTVGWVRALLANQPTLS